MAMLYLTPVLPLGLVSYMCGTTAMKLHNFAVAKIASLPLYLMYTFMGASAHSFIKGGNGGKNDGDLGKSLAEEANKLEENQYLILCGLILSAVMIALISRKIKKELMKVRYCYQKGIFKSIDRYRTEIHCGYQQIAVVDSSTCTDMVAMDHPIPTRCVLFISLLDIG